ncbi:trifunctional MMPL family transporter/lysophospholipid acyltransferase/class I SAM-dependent methyltransferase [Massilibacteroides vaginae]|uniref:trifunctional MMPL family transporter/lysophospholipid acyltransferase/class I SAM-dependent methyltransferase n=1 Tax=Massilibacteroides vaginae TaxID=1673718 RepID=UPI000A1C9CE4|nr:trifunctional MMPL family transporter/lysophospholipid acyltransferase/class I SAM-dependent methyltransferase [Massilibacteroides vaginae]
MGKFFVHIYTVLHRHPVLRNFLLFGSFILMLIFAVQIKPEEDITRFFPDSKDSKRTEEVFKNLKVKDKIIVMLSSRDTLNPVLPGDLIQAGTQLNENLSEEDMSEYITDITFKIDSEVMGKLTGLIYEHLPAFLRDEDFARMDSLFTAEGIADRMRTNYMNLLSPTGMATGKMMTKDPMGLGFSALKRLQEFQNTSNYELWQDHIFSPDMSTLLLILSPKYGIGSTGKNDILIKSIEEMIALTEHDFSEVSVTYFGGPAVSVYNARQIKSDTMLTLTIALLIIIVFVSVVFRSRSALLLILLPVIYGGTFALALIFLIKGSISAIAIGAGTIVFGIALSYSIHVLSHFNHVTSIPQLIKELAYPLTVGSFTTIGAFLGLLFTTSALLRDFGLFSALSLVGTTFFCLIFLPHLLKKKADSQQSNKVLQLIERINGYAYEKNKPLIISLTLIFLACIYLSGKVGFDGNMMNINFEPPHLKAAEEKLTDLFQTDNKTTLFISSGESTNEALQQYNETNRKLEKLRDEGLIKNFSSAESLLIPIEVQQERIARWQSFWTAEKKAFVKEEIRKNLHKYRFKEASFQEAFALLEENYKPLVFDNGSSVSLLDDWMVNASDIAMFITQVKLDESHKEAVYEQFTGENKPIIFDRSFYANQWVASIHDNFYLVLYISSFLIFFALLISYGRLELTLMTLAPLTISWVMILGLMAITGTEFNIVNIILSTFIFGLGDDFCIFIMDGLLQEYRTGKKVLNAHKTAIFFSSFTAVVGLGALVFAQHPALQSISVISLLGMCSVVLVSYTLLPILFRFFIAKPTAKGNYPYTISSILTTVWFFNLFLIGCSLMVGLASILILIPVKRNRKKAWFSLTLMHLLRVFLKTTWPARKITKNFSSESFEKPAIIVANHQSFLDILLLLSLAPKLVMVTNSWVWQSPFFGRIVRYADFMHTTEGYENALEHLKKKVAEGYSVIVFPEGTRSIDCQVKRFHKGAFYLAHELQLDIIPIILYGTGMVISKRQPFYIKRGILAMHIYPRIKHNEDVSYQERTKKTATFFREKYAEAVALYGTSDNPHFYQQLVTNYIYKGPVEEWYTRIKVKLEDQYTLFHNLIPREAKITDVGCGFGMMPYMLNMYADTRTIEGLDYDEDKVAVANHNFSKNEQLSFRHADALTADLQESDVFIISDMLHYIDFDSQQQLLSRCAQRLLPGGMLIVRDSDAGKQEKHALTRLTELFSTRLLGFNKKVNALYFPDKAQFVGFAERHNLKMQAFENDKLTSNTIYLFTRQETIVHEI